MTALQPKAGRRSSLTQEMQINPMDKPVAITMGDAAGIGPEIVAKAFRDAAHLCRGCFVAGDVATMRRASACIARPGQQPLPVAVLEHIEEALAVPPGCIPVVQVGRPQPLVPFGRVSASGGALAGACVAWAAQAALRVEVGAMVTAPLNKLALSAAGGLYAGYPGHTEMLQALAAQFSGRTVAELPVRMMLANDELRTVLVSIHLSLRQAIEAVDFDNVFQTLQITDRALRGMLGRAPRIAVAGLNPHAGEGGLFGQEEIDIISPAIEAARAAGMCVDGPVAPDTVFMRARSRQAAASEFDVVVAMYHDQGLIPVKYLGLDQGVNVTLGLPFIRTSPDHGTAFDIAGKGTADAASMVAAIRMARQLAGFSPR